MKTYIQNLQTKYLVSETPKLLASLIVPVLASMDLMSRMEPTIKFVSKMLRPIVAVYRNIFPNEFVEIGILASAGVALCLLCGW